MLDFNPRTLKGYDHENPNRGLDLRLFQSTYPQGVRPDERIWCCVQYIFQSTYPQGVRRKRNTFWGGLTNFNPRTLKGYDVQKAAVSPDNLNFNPRTLKGYDVFDEWRDA